MAERELPRPKHEARAAVRDHTQEDAREAPPVRDEGATNARADARPNRNHGEQRGVMVCELGVDDLFRHHLQVDDRDRDRCRPPFLEPLRGRLKLRLPRHAHDERGEVPRPLERRAGARCEELGPDLPVQPEQLRRVVRAPREEALADARVRELPVLLRDLVATRCVVQPAPLAPAEQVHGRHAVDGGVPAEETGDA